MIDRIVIRVRCDSQNCKISLGAKFGCEEEEAIRLMHFIKNVGLTLWGFSFHVGSPCDELNAYVRGIAICKKLIAIAREIGCEDAQLIDIGGGFPGNRGFCIDKVRYCSFFLTLNVSKFILTLCGRDTKLTINQVYLFR